MRRALLVSVAQDGHPVHWIRCDESKAVLYPACGGPVVYRREDFGHFRVIAIGARHTLRCKLCQDIIELTTKQDRNGEESLFKS